MRLRALMLGLAMVLVSTPAQAMVRLLLAVGSNEGLTNEAPLRYAELDAVRLRDVFVELGGVARARAHLLRGATKDDVVRALLRLQGQVEEVRARGERAEVVVTFSGHGDDASVHLNGQALTRAELLALTQATQADAVVVLVDACRQSPIRSGASRGVVHGPAFDVTLVKDPSPKGQVVLSSASAGEVAQESDDVEGAWFTHHLLAGLRGAADLNGDAQVTLPELWRHAHARTVAQSFSATSQHPELSQTLTGESELVLTRLSHAAAQLVLPGPAHGSYLVVDDESGDIVTEVDKATGAPLMLAMPARHVRVQRRRGNELAATDIVLTRGDRVTLADERFKVMPRVASRGRGADLDPSPWEASIAFMVSNTPVLKLGSALALGGLVRMERRLDQSDVFVGATVLGRRGQSVTVAARRFDNADVHAVLGIRTGWRLPLGALSAGGGLGAHATWQSITRPDAARLRDAQIDLPSAKSTAYGPTALLQAAWSVPLPLPIAANVGVELVGLVSALRADGEVVLQSGAALGASLGLAW